MVASKSCRSTDLVAHLGQYFEDHTEQAGRFCVGLSGGRDSVVLLHALSRLPFSDSMMALHVHHGLSPHADAWEAHCRELCGTLGVEFSVARVQVDLNAGLGLEGAARAARYRAFAQCGAETLMLAHHQGDQVETLLLNLLRGSGVSGAAAMPAKRFMGQVRLLRPLLDISPAELADYADANKLSWIEDESNEDTRLRRNFLRHEIMHRLGQCFPDAARSLCRSSQHFAEADVLLGELAEIDWSTCSSGEELRLIDARQLSTQRLKNLLRWRLRQLGWQMPVTTRLNEFTRQLMSAAPDRHPALILPEGKMQVGKKRLMWISREKAPGFS